MYVLERLPEPAGVVFMGALVCYMLKEVALALRRPNSGYYVTALILAGIAAASFIMHKYLAKTGSPYTPVVYRTMLISGLASIYPGVLSGPDGNPENRGKGAIVYLVLYTAFLVFGLYIYVYY